MISCLKYEPDWLESQDQITKSFCMITSENFDQKSISVFVHTTFDFCSLSHIILSLATDELESI
jgi:hypothetical protein